jgi:hypothetical protein
MVMDPSDVTRKVVENNLRVVWRGSQRVNLSVCVYVFVIVKCGGCGFVGGGGNNRHNSRINFRLFITLFKNSIVINNDFPKQNSNKNNNYYTILSVAR